MAIFSRSGLRRLVLPAILLLLVGGGAAGFFFFAQAEPPPRFRLAKVDTGTIVSAVSATGSVNPVVTVLVGSQLSGQIKELLADFNTPVKSGQIIARLDADQIEARMAQAKADLKAAEASLMMQRAQADRARADIDTARANVANNKANVVRSEALLKDAEREYKRKRDLLGRGAGTAADSERAETAVDTAQAQLVSARAQLEAAVAALEAAQAALKVSESQIAAAQAQIAQRHAAVQQVQVDLDRAEIRSPIDGVVIQRSIDVGQTVAASFQAPELFRIAQDLRRIEIWASVDEGDIGRVQAGQDVTFTVTAFPGTTFRGEVMQVRLGPQTIQNVVTYTVVIAADNPDLRLLPGMTATVRIVSDRRDDVLRVPNAALRYRPPGAPGMAEEPVPAGPQRGPGNAQEFAKRLISELSLTADQQRELSAIMEDSRREFIALREAGLPPDQLRSRGQAVRARTGERIAAILTPEQLPRYQELRAAQRSVTSASSGRIWVIGADGDPQPVPVRLGIGDGTVTEIVSGDIKPGQEVIVGGGARPATPTGPGPRLGF
ncbi:MAG TPA: efflux RND transporter periplasmic adaptor subunit [Alphaproteobacteria bacterium]|nr:efflux RND transporter periplasmic adaptor subunit [Alphaproteobacteria bacterium]